MVIKENPTMVSQSVLGERGAALAAAPSIRDLFKSILKHPYDPDRAPDGFINIGTAENYVMLEEVKKFIDEHRVELSEKNLTYGEGPWGTERFRKAMAKYLKKYSNAVDDIDPDDIILANGLSSIMHMFGQSIFDPGDGIMLTQPCYSAFSIDFGTIAQVQGVYVPFHGVDQFSTDALAKYEAAYEKAVEDGIKVRALMLCNPHNPLGQCYPKDTIIELMKFCDKRQLHLISDEVYTNSVYDIPDKAALPFTSALSFDSSKYISPDYLHMMYGMSKDLGGGGLRMGVAYIRSKELMRAMSAFAQFHWSGAPSEVVGTMMLEDEKWLEEYFNLNRQRLADGNKLCRKLLDDAGINYSHGSNAGFFMWMDLRPFLPKKEANESEWGPEQRLSKSMMDNKVFVTPGEGQHADEPGFFRIIFSQDERVLKTGIKRMVEVLKG